MWNCYDLVNGVDRDFWGRWGFVLNRFYKRSGWVDFGVRNWSRSVICIRFWCLVSGCVFLIIRKIEGNIVSKRFEVFSSNI